jgi:hypothetical protein
VRRPSRTALVLTMLTLGAVVRADEWDVGTSNDNQGDTTENALLHGSEQVHDLGGPAPDEDWYRVTARPFSSFQFVIDGQTGDLDLQPGDVDRLLFDGIGSLQNAELQGGLVTMSWMQGEPAADDRQLVRVGGAACGTSCDTRDRYRVRFYDTTYTIPRFNNSGTQSTVLAVQNASGRPCAVAFAFLDDGGSLVHLTLGTPVAVRGLLVLPTATLVPNQSGSARVMHTCGYGGLAGKAASVEPATGFTFDTAMLPRPHGR